MVCCFCVGVCFAVKNDIMLDLMFALAWRMRLYKMGTQNREFTCEVCHSQHRSCWGANDGVFLSIAYQYSSPLNTAFRFGPCLAHCDNHYIHFGGYMCISSIFDCFWLTLPFHEVDCISEFSKPI